MTIGIRNLVRLAVGLGLLMALGSPAPATAADEAERAAPEPTSTEEEEERRAQHRPHLPAVPERPHERLLLPRHPAGARRLHRAALGRALLQRVRVGGAPSSATSRSAAASGTASTRTRRSRRTARTASTRPTGTRLISLSFRARHLSLTTIYYFYTSPNGAFAHRAGAELQARVGRQRDASAASRWGRRSTSRSRRTARRSARTRARACRWASSRRSTSSSSERLPVTFTRAGRARPRDRRLLRGRGRDDENTFGYLSFGLDGEPAARRSSRRTLGAWSFS